MNGILTTIEGVSSPEVKSAFGFRIEGWVHSGRLFGQIAISCRWREVGSVSSPLAENKERQCPRPPFSLGISGDWRGENGKLDTH